MPLFALTGGIAAGKSTVAARLRELGAHVISADELARFVQQKGSPTLEAIIEQFGHEILNADGDLDRAKLGKEIFADDAARSRLEAIVHPAIQNEFRTQSDAILKADPSAIIVYDIPLLLESKRVGEFDGVIVVTCPPEIRRERLMTIRGMTEAEADARIAAQATEAERLAVADWVIDASRTVEHTRAGTDTVWKIISTNN